MIRGRHSPLLVTRGGSDHVCIAFAMSSSSESFPSAARHSASTAVTALLIDAAWKSVSGVASQPAVTMSSSCA